MRLAYVATSQIPSRFANTIQVLNMCHAFSTIGWDVTLFVPGRPYRDIKSIFDNYSLPETFSIKWIMIPNIFGRFRGILMSIAVQSSLHTWIKQSDELSVVYTRIPWLGLVFPYKNIFFESHYLPDDQKSLKCQAIIKAVKTSIAHGATKAIFAISEGLLQRWRAVGIQCVHLLHDATNLEMFKTLSKSDARCSLSLPLDRTIVVYAGQLSPSHGSDVILEVAYHLPEILFILVGGLEKDITRIRKIITSRNISNVILIGHIPHKEVPPYLVAADLLIAPYSSRWQYASVASPLKLFEYMAAGRPIIASNIPAVSRIIEHGQTGILVPPDDPNALARAIKMLLANPQTCYLIASAARQKSLNYSWVTRAKTATEIILSYF